MRDTIRIKDQLHALESLCWMLASQALARQAKCLCSSSQTLAVLDLLLKQILPQHLLLVDVN